ncbi:hypothetical protein I6E50_02515 [Roseburia hominis]|uniref:DUF2201 family putative metallopeptidase n=1 Tax=Roseburia hominis TaxID=301301 RepID=UPI001F2D1A3D|nr:hypothetical protein [Roseburia hominis]
MITFHRKYYYRDEHVPAGYAVLEQGVNILLDHPLFCQLKGDIYPKSSHLNERGSVACVTANGQIYTNYNTKLTAEEWAYALAHCLLHPAFGHFDSDKIPQTMEYFPAVWNKACDIYITRFLMDIGFGSPLVSEPALSYPKIRMNDETKIYEYLLTEEGTEPRQNYGLNTDKDYDMIGLNHPIVYKNHESNPFAARFSYAITHSVKDAVSNAGGHMWNEKKDTNVTRAADWFLSHFPLLGGLAASFQIIEDVDKCHHYHIQIAAVDATCGEIYANPSCGFSEEEWKFVLAHEYLHAGLCHHKRCQGRDTYLWNVACDYVINDWLNEMQIGVMPSEGLDFQIIKGRGFIPAGLIEEIRALSMPPIPWEVELAEWFDAQFPPLEKHRTYARPSRRQEATPDIPRPSYTLQKRDLTSRTFGVVIDTSGSMSTKQIGLALGAIASYAVSKDVPYVRLIFCDAKATDAGYLPPEEIAGRVEVTGRGGTVLQPGVDALEKAKDFPVNGPILVITDGYIEPDLKIKREHAFLIPKGNRLPFTPKGKVFYMK